MSTTKKWNRFLMVLLLVLPMFLMGSTKPAAGSQTVATNQEADIIVVDRTTSRRAWKETRAGVLNRVASAFGGYVSDKGCPVGDGAMGDISIIPLGPNVSALDLVTVMKRSDLQQFASKIYNEQQCSVIKRIEPQVLSDSGSLWTDLTKSQLSKNSLSKVSQSGCEGAGTAKINASMKDPAFRFAIQSVERNTSKAKIVSGMCGIIVKVAKGIAKIDTAIKPKSYCRVASDGCSDILSVLPVISQQLSDAKHLERSASKIRACTLLSSDMIQVDSSGSILKLLKTPDQARKLARTKLQEYGGAWPKPSRGVVVYMPYLGVTPGVVISPAKIQLLRIFWTELFTKAGATIGTGSAEYACSGDE